MSTIEERIAELRERIQAGVERVAVGDQRADFNLESDRRELAKLLHEQNPAKRPRASQIDLSW